MNAYHILECDREASQDEIKTNYHRLILKYHPDKYQSNDNDNDKLERFIRLQTAYKVLSDPKSRFTYDTSLKQIELQDKATLLQDSDHLLSLNNDFEFDNSTKSYNYNCRCGSLYLIKSIDLNKILESFSSNDSLILTLECDTCSMCINVLII
jgi:diphthamide biosynthesis protein 4